MSPRPCPFCAAFLVTRSDSTVWWHPYVAGCILSGRNINKDDGSIAMWNMRPYSAETDIFDAIVACQNLDDFRSVQTSVQRIREVRS